MIFMNRNKKKICVPNNLKGIYMLISPIQDISQNIMVRRFSSIQKYGL